MLEELKTFIAVTELQSFTRAAEQLNISQPTVSLHIKRLEEYFDEILIYRSRQQKKAGDYCCRTQAISAGEKDA